MIRGKAGGEESRGGEQKRRRDRGRRGGGSVQKKAAPPSGSAWTGRQLQKRTNQRDSCPERDLTFRRRAPALREAMLPPALCVTLLAAACAPWPPAVQAASCEPVRIPLCRSMPWNMTKMPNHLHHSTQDNAVLAIEQFEGLLGTGCSPDLLFFLCAMYAPICTIDFQQEPIKPCKAVCERAKLGCEPVMKRYNHSWPDSLDCSELPLYDRGVCISPEAIVKAEGPDPYNPDSSRCNPESSPDSPMDSNSFHCRGPNAGCKCKTIKMSLKTYLRNNYNYVIRARVREVRNRGLEPTAVVEVKEVLKSSLVNIPKETQTLYYSSSCLCPPLLPGEEYIIMGYEDEERSRLLLIESSIAQKWKDRMGRKVKRWDMTLQEKNILAIRRARP